MLPTLIVVDREKCLMEVYRKGPLAQQYKLKRTYPVTVGKVGSETPHGMYFVKGKSREPDWMIPPSPDYPESTWGTVIHHGEPGCPFKEAFISLAGPETGLGLHDTTFDARVGTASSHGCVRMLTEHVLEIYKWCKIGTPVYLH